MRPAVMRGAGLEFANRTNGLLDHTLGLGLTGLGLFHCAIGERIAETEGVKLGDGQLGLLKRFLFRLVENVRALRVQLFDALNPENSSG